MKKNNNKHLCFSQRVKLQYCLDHNYNRSAKLLSKQLNVSRWTIYYEIKTNRSKLRTKDVVFNQGKSYHCELLDKFPFAVMAVLRHYVHTEDISMMLMKLMRKLERL